MSPTEPLNQPIDCCMLIVDDEPYVPDALKRILRRDIRSIHTANSATEALEVMARLHVDVLLTDYQMPGMSGAELCSAVAQSHPDTVRIMLSGQADMAGVIDAINNGSIYKFVTKPWAADVIRPLLREAAELALADRSRVDSTTGWLSRGAFLTRANARLADGSIGIICGEFENSARLFAAAQLPEGRSIFELLSARCRAVLGNHAELAAIGNGTFALISDGASTPGALNTLSQALQEPIEARDGILRPKARLGASTFADSAEILLHQALVALTAAEDSGRPFVSYDPNLRSDLHRRWSLEQDLASARANGELYYVMQPMVHAQTGELGGAELLMRWNHPLRGPLEPAEFIDLAEQTGLICDLGQWIIEQGVGELECASCRDFHISVNVSPRQFADRRLLEGLGSTIASADIDPTRLVVEITESCVMENFGFAVELLEELRTLGVRVALDDFGTGHSSLAQLRRLPVDVVKIDRAFLPSMADVQSERLFTHVVHLARSIGMQVIAEGIETHEHLALCRRSRVDLVQGFLLGEPVTREAFLQQWTGTGLEAVR